MEGPLSIVNPPTAPHHAATKLYVDNNVGFLGYVKSTTNHVGNASSTVGWTNPNGVKLLDGTVASFTYAPPSPTAFDTPPLLCQDWAFAITSGVRILGVAVRLCDSPFIHCTTYLQLYDSDSGSVYGVPRQIRGPGGGRDIMVGGMGDTWGVPLTRDMVNSNGFSLKLWYGGTWDDTHTIEVDYIEMIVYYGNPFGDIEAQTVKLTGTPDSPSDAVNLGYVDSRIIVSSNIADGAVTVSKLAPGAVTTGKLAPDVDARYLRRDTTGMETMLGTLSVPTLAVTGNDDWKVGGLSAPDVNITLVGANSKITTASGSGKNLELDCDGSKIVLTKDAECQGRITANKGIKVTSPWAGSVTLQSGSSIKTVDVPGMLLSDIVIATRRGTAAGNCAVEPYAEGGGFTLKGSGGETYYYLVIRP